MDSKPCNGNTTRVRQNRQNRLIITFNMPQYKFDRNNNDKINYHQNHGHHQYTSPGFSSFPSRNISHPN